VPRETPAAWRERWAEAAEAFGQAPPPLDFVDPPGTVAAEPRGVAQRNSDLADAALARALRLLGGAGRARSD
jgi:hypothetical protein